MQQKNSSLVIMPRIMQDAHKYSINMYDLVKELQPKTYVYNIYILLLMRCILQTVMNVLMYT